MNVSKNEVIVKVFLIVLFVFIGFAIGAICWTYSINTWLDYFGKDSSIQW